MGISCDSWGRQEPREAACRGATVAVVESGRQATIREAGAQRVLAALTGVTHRLDTSRLAGEPRVEGHSLTHPAGLHARSNALYRPYYFVAQDLGEGDESPERVVEVAVEEDLLDVAAADAAKGRPHDGPVIPEKAGLLNLLQLHGGAPPEVSAGRELAEDPGTREARQGVAKDEGLHGAELPFRWDGALALCVGQLGYLD